MQRSLARLAVAAGTAIAVLVAGLPAQAVPSPGPEAPADESPPTLAELRAGELAAPEPDARRRAEESGRRDADRPRPDGVDPVAVTARGSGSRWSPPPPEPPVRSRGPVEWPEPGRSVATLSARAGSEAVLETLDRSVARRHGAAVAVSVQPSGVQRAGSGAAPVSVTMDYSGFGHAIGGDYGSRLRAKAYPVECVRAGRTCAGEPLDSDNDQDAQTVTASVPLSGAGTVVMLTADEGGPAGDWSATSLSPSAEWSHGGHSGDFSWSYPLRTPELPGGLGPELSIGYSSGSVDGRTLSTNNQTSWLGEGFSLGTGFVQRQYAACAEDMGSGANNDTKTGDRCWKSDNAVLSLGGSASELVKDASTGTWRPKHDDGSRVQRLTGAGNGARNGEYWRVTTTDGTQYYFGRHRRYAGDTAATNSVFTVPVAGNHSGEPCHASSFDDSFCTQAWRWNLDYVVDPNGNTMTYFYSRESNRYGRNLDDDSVSYHRGGYLKRIEYGQRKGNEHTTPAPGRVVFTVAERCLPGGGVSCRPGELDEDTADKWPDVPYDRICSSSSSCPEQVSPTFFSRKRLARVETQVRVSGSYQPVDRWAFTHKFPDPGDGNSAALWLDRITHSGRAGGTTTLPSVRFSGMAMPNRVPEVDTAPLVNRYRLLAVTSETGAVTSVNYSEPDCRPGETMPSPHTNDRRCYPVYWLPEGAEHDDPEIYWFHKYVVDTVTEIDGTGDSVEVETHYSYGGSPAWAYDDSDFTDADYRTWNQWRGYGRVTTRVGKPSTDQLRTDRRYLRGMHGDRAGPSGGTRNVSVTDSWGDSVTDHEHFTGMLREEIVYDGSTKVTSTVHDPWRSAATASGGGERARMVDIAATRVHTRLAAGGWRTTETRYTYDSRGLVVETDDRGDTSTTADDLCTRVAYARNTSKWILETVKHTETVAKRCTAAPSRPGDVVTAERAFYDGGGYGDAPTKGNVTRSQVLDSWSGSPGYVTVARTSYDAHGRVVSRWDALDRRTTTAYAPATGGPVTSVTVTNPAGHVSVTELDPRRGVPTRITDPNGRVSEATYDPLGRLRKVWRTDRDRATETPSLEYRYRVSATEPAAVSTLSLLPSDERATSVQLYDSLLRPRQAQAPAAGDTGGRLVTSTEYDSRGLVVEERGPYYAAGAPSTALVEPVTTSPRRVLTSYDGAGRVTLERLMVHQSEHSRRGTTHGGDRVHVTPPAGGIPTTTITDARGNTTERREYHGTQPAGTYDATHYTHTPRGDLASVTDPAGNVWTYQYDLRGRRIAAHDPDAGVNTTSYDHAGQVTTTTDGRDQAMVHTYDALGRKVRTRVGSASGEVRAEWVYDTLEKGQLTSSTSHHDGAAYTTTVYGYDDAYRSLGETVTIPASEGALAGDYQTYRTYHPDGSLKLQWLAGHGGLPQETLWHHYDAAGNPEWLSGARTYVADTSYSPFGEVEQRSLGVNLGRASWQTFYYEEGTRRLARLQVDREGYTPSDVDRSYSYDAAGNPRSIADTGSPGDADVQCFQYDHQRRLTEAWAQASTGCAGSPSASVVGGAAPYWHSYRYDLAGNRTRWEAHGTGGAAGTVTSYSHPAPGQPRPHAVTTASRQTGTGPTEVTSYDYDQAGNLTSAAGPDGVTTYQWDPEGELGTVTTPDGTGGAVYAADGGRLIRRTPERTTLYLAGDELALDHDTGQVTGTRHYRLGGTTLAVRTAGGTVSSLATGHQFTPLVAIDENNGIIRRWQDPYGNPRGPQPAAWPGERGFHTGTEDSFTGLVHLGARPYDPALGQFLSVDPLLRPGDSQQIQGYSYARNNPLLLTDPNGLTPVPGRLMALLKFTHMTAPKGAAKRGAGSVAKAAAKGAAKGARKGSSSANRSPSKGATSRPQPETATPGYWPQSRNRPTVRDALESTLELVTPAYEQGLSFPGCIAGFPDPTGMCAQAREAFADSFAQGMVYNICDADAVAAAFCALPAPDYLTIDVLGKVGRGRGLEVGAEFTVTRTGRVTNRTRGGVGASTDAIQPKRGAAVDVKVGWLYDDGAPASTAQVDGYPAAGWSGDATTSASVFGQKLFSVAHTFGDRNNGLDSQEIQLPGSAVSISGSASLSYTSELANFDGSLW